MQITAELRNWKKATYLNGDIYWGNVYNDTKGRFKNGALIRTSLVKAVQVHSCGSDILAITLNSVYLLKEEHRFTEPRTEAQMCPAT